MEHTVTKLAILFLWTLAPAAVLSSEAGEPAHPGNAQEWNFRVYLDDSAIGYHHFRLSREQDRQRLVTEAQFQVKFLFITAYRYQHENTELWQGQCLQQIQSRTDANGKVLSVRGSQGDDGFELKAAGAGRQVASRQVDGCVKTFAYWDPSFLQESALLNSQTGEIIPVQIEPLGRTRIRVRGRQVAAEGYRMRGDNLDMQIWYSPDHQWLGLESTIKGGRTLRYELI